MSDWILATEESGYTRHFGTEALPVSIGGGQGNDINLAGVRGSVQIGCLDDVFFLQPARDTQNLRLGGERITGSRRLADGDVIALDSARLTCRISGGRLTVSIDAQVTAGDTAPPDFDELARSEAAEVEIAPVAFQPAAQSGATRAGLPIGKGSMAVTAAFVVLAVLAWFAFTAKSVSFEFVPAADEVSLPDTLFQFRLGDRYLLRPGQHRLTATLDGYYPHDSVFEVGQLASQTIEIEMIKLPGLVTFETKAGVPATVRIDGEPVGTTPLRDLEVVPGTHQVEFVADRHLPEVLELDVEGGHIQQSAVVELTPSWAPVRVSSEPSGAEIRVDGEVVGTTPMELELTAGEREIELALRGYNAWRDRIMVVADVAQDLPRVTLSQADGRVELISDPADATVSVDGEYRGRTPLTLRLRPGREHTISIGKPGYETALRELSVAADSGRSVSVELAAIYGQVSVESSPEGAEIWVDGRRLGSTPNSLDLMAIEHDIEVRQEGYTSAARTITPRPGYPQTLSFELTKLDQTTGSGYPGSITTALGQELRLIPAGRFTMGSSRREQGRRSNEVLREVEITRAFYLGAREVTNAEFREFRAEHDSGAFGGQSLDGDDQPVVNVTWEEAAEFLNWLSIRDGLQPVYTNAVGGMVARRPLRNGYRLPTEAEWAWAARRAGRDETLIYPWGNELRPPEDRVVNLADLSAAEILPTTLVTYNDGFPVSAPVGSFDRNPVGLYDISGNVAEWTQDYYEIVVLPSEEVILDPLGPESGRFHVVRGPSWRTASITDLRMAYRNNSADLSEDIGFRIARNVE